MSSDFSSDERERERDQSAFCVAKSKAAMIEEREREREREKTSFLSSSKGALSLPSFFYPDAEYF